MDERVYVSSVFLSYMFVNKEKTDTVYSQKSLQNFKVSKSPLCMVGKKTVSGGRRLKHLLP